MGEAIANMLLGTQEVPWEQKLKLFLLAQKLIKDKEVGLDIADFELVKKSVESSKVYNLLVSGQVIEILTNLK